MTDQESDTYEDPTDRKNRVLAELRAHPSYEAVKATKGYAEPSMAELDEHAESAAFAALPRAKKLAGLVDDLLVTARNQAKHNAPLSPGMVKDLEAIRSLIG